jgi:hypothetical protein
MEADDVGGVGGKVARAATVRWINNLTFTLLIVALLTTLGCGGYNDDVDIEGSRSFAFASNMYCDVVSATDPDSVGESIDFLDVNSESPRVRFGRTGVRSPMNKVFETEGLLVVQLVASGSGSVDALTLNKSTGLFVRTYSGGVTALYAGAAHGFCR